MTLVRCPKCDGKGYISVYAHVEGGVCFQCGGKGRIRATSHKATTSASHRTTRPYTVDAAAVLVKIDQKITAGQNTDYWQSVRRSVERGDRLTQTELKALA